MRFEPDVIDLLLKLKWWDFDVEKLKAVIPVLMGANKQDLMRLVEEESRPS